MPNVSWKMIWSGAAALALALAIASPATLARDRDDDDRRHGKRDDLRISTLSSRPDTVSGGDVLVRIEVPRNVPLRGVRVELNDRNITGAFRRDESKHQLIGLVTGLRLGRNELEASTKRSGHARADRLVVVNHPLSGPVISGPHQDPFICETQVFGLGAALDEDCSANTRVEYLYRSSTSNSFQPLDPAAPLPPDVAQTTTSTGNTVPYVVRRETGVINRAVYQIAFLHVPGQALPDPWTSTPGWNRRLLYTFGGGCMAGYHQGRSTGGVPEEGLLGDYPISKGYAVASSSLNVFGTNCNEVLSAETLMMVKEYFIERLGVPIYTMGAGGSGGAMQQHLITHSYPGLLDGIMPGRSFPDTVTFLLNSVAECVLLSQAFDTSTLPWSDAQKSAVGGYNTFLSCTMSGPPWRARMVVPTTCDASVPASLIYDATSNPGGVRCTYADNLQNVYGTDPSTGFAGRALDNVGIQYGLKAFNAGIISAEQFIDLNARVGGFDVDGNVQPARMQADPIALAIAYRTGRLNSGSGGFAMVPIIDIRAYWDHFDDVHDSVRTEIMRARLIEANGHAKNQVRIIAETVGSSANDRADPTSPLRQMNRYALDAMDAWLAKIAADTAPARSRLERVVRNKPVGLVDSCHLTSGERITDYAQCLQKFSPRGNPRLAAGEPLTQDVLKCQLKPVRRADYASPLSEAQLARLREIFPRGVCDYSKRGVAQSEFEDTWLAFPRPGFGVRLDKGGDDDRRGHRRHHDDDDDD